MKSPTLVTLIVSLCVMSVAFAQLGDKPLWGWSTVAEYEAATGNTIAEFSESPKHRDLVAQGDLPPIAERLPTEPVVDNPFESVGTYGGSLTLAQVSNSIGYPASNFTTFEPLFSLGRDGQEIVPNIAKGWEFSDDGTVFTIFLREGMRWSDGEPFDADDIMFFWNDIMLNTDLTGTVPLKYRPGGEVMVVDRIDDHTVQFSFSVPYFSILPNLAGVVFTGSQGDAFEARHYLEQFHIDYNPDAESLAREAGFETWMQHFESKRYYWWRVTDDVPTVGPWRIVQRTPEATVLEANPYYFKVDTEGNQLPYIDRVVATNFGDTANLAVRMVAGQYDYQDWGTSMDDMPAFVDGAERGDYRVWLAPSLWTSVAAYSVNQNYVGDENVAEVLRDVRFRQALSLGIDREEINQIVALGQGTPLQATISPTASVYREEWGQHYIEFDAERANSLLDEMGMDQRDGSGYRLGPDGSPFTLIVSNVPDAVPPRMSELVAGYWQDLGIRTTVRNTERALMGEQFNSGDFMIAGWAMDGVSEQAIKIGASGYYTGYQWAPQWQAWFNSDGASGEEPPAEVQRMFELYRTIRIMPEDEQDAALTEMMDIWMDGLYRIGTIGAVPKPAIAKTGLGNVDEETYTDNASVGIGFFNRHYQFYWR